MLNQLGFWAGLIAFSKGRKLYEQEGRFWNTLLPLLPSEELLYRSEGCWVVG